MSFPYFYGRAAEQYAFYRIPKLLFSDERFEALSTDAKLLYGIIMSALIHTMIGKHHLKLDMLGEFFEQSVTKMLDHYTFISDPFFWEWAAVF